ncbi:MAG: HNH endonuclease family protein [Bacteroidetes bacterium]|nr:HNH endonuclease family protein [Bacteroidota bacterium]
MYSSYAIKIEKEKNAVKVVDIILEFIEKLKLKIPSIEEFKINFNELIYTDKFTKYKNLVKYILQKYDCYMRKGDIIDYSKMTIEHLIPQNSKSHKIEENILGSIGNLMLVDEDTNSNKLKNKVFSEKKKILKESNYPLDNILIKNDELSKDIIVQRTNHIAEVGYNKIWKI